MRQRAVRTPSPSPRITSGTRSVHNASRRAAGGKNTQTTVSSGTIYTSAAGDCVLLVQWPSKHPAWRETEFSQPTLHSSQILTLRINFKVWLGSFPKIWFLRNLVFSLHTSICLLKKSLDPFSPSIIALPYITFSSLNLHTQTFQSSAIC